MRLRPLAALAILAALLGAPSSVLGAGSGLVHPGSTSSADSTGTVDGIADEPVARGSTSDDGWTPVVVVGVTGVGVMAAAGTGLLVASRRRRAGGSGSTDSAATAPDPDDRVEQLLRRRSLRRARAQLTEDPIVAALGLGDPSDDERRRRRRNAESTAPNRQLDR